MTAPRKHSDRVYPHIREIVAERDSAWRADAACKGVDGNVFFPGQGVSPEPALEFCRVCPEATVAACLDYALRTHQAGIWGNTSDKQRRSMRRRLRVVA